VAVQYLLLFCFRSFFLFDSFVGFFLGLFSLDPTEFKLEPERTLLGVYESKKRTSAAEHPKQSASLVVEFDLAAEPSPTAQSAAGVERFV
jgi:hypothetical protein